MHKGAYTQSTAYMLIWMAASREKVMGGTDRCRTSLLKAKLPESALSRQSVDRLPLVNEEKAKLAVLNIHFRVSGVGMLTCPIKEIYCSHSVNACSMACQGVHMSQLGLS